MINPNDIPQILEDINGGSPHPEGVETRGIDRRGKAFYCLVYFDGVGLCKCTQSNTFTIIEPA